MMNLSDYIEEVIEDVKEADFLSDPILDSIIRKWAEMYLNLVLEEALRRGL